MSSPGPKGQPQFVGGDTVTLAAYLSSLGNYAALVGNTIVGNASDRAAFNSVYGYAPWYGLLFRELDTRNEFLFTGNGWVGVKSQTALAVMDTTPSTTGGGYAWTKNIAFAPGRFTAAPTVTFGVYTSAAANQHVGAEDVTTTGFTLYYWRQTNITTTVGWTATPLD